MANSSDVDETLMNKLAADPELTTLLPDGVWWALADPHATRFLLVSQIEHDDAYVLTNRVGWERFVYLVKAVTRGYSGVDVNAAENRIYALLHHGTMTVPGYHPPMVMQRLERIRYPETDEATNTRWQHCGGQYEVTITPL
jgi:hypothetical protein